MMYVMQLKKMVVLGCLWLGLAHAGIAQTPEPDKSPLDVSYAPHNFAIQKLQGKVVPAQPLARVLYSRPQKNGRNLFGKEIAYGQLWRLGANESTEIELFTNATIGGKKLNKGRYTMYCIPQADSWTVIFNKELHTWGAFSYKQANDALRMDVPVARIHGAAVEHFSIFFNETNHLVIAWDDVRVIVPIEFAIAK